MRSEYQGLVLGSDLPRLLESSAGYCSDFNVQFSCDIDNQGLVVLHGKASGELSLICQRCMDEFTYSLAADYCFTPVASESEDLELPDDYEPVVVDEFGQIEIKKLIEDELILSIPIVPKHPVEDCSVTEDDMTAGEIDESADERPNPFAVLQSLKK